MNIETPIIDTVRVSCGKSCIDVSVDPYNIGEYEFDTGNGVMNLTEEDLNNEELLNDLTKNDLACMKYAVLKLKTIND